MSKPLSELLDNFQVKITQIRALENEAYVDRESFLKIKRIAVELAKALEIYQIKYMELGPIEGHEYMEADVVLTELYSEIKLSRVKDILESK